MDYRIQTTGLKELNEGLKFFETGVARSVRPILRAFANRVRERIASAYYERGYETHRSIDGGGLRATATSRVATIILGGERFPWLLGQEFGSDRYPQFPNWSGNSDGGVGSNGYFMFPTLRRELPGMSGDLADMVDEYAARAFPAGVPRMARRR